MNREPFSQRGERRLDLIETRSVPEVEEPVDLRFLPAEPAGKIDQEIARYK